MLQHSGFCLLLLPAAIGRPGWSVLGQAGVRQLAARVPRPEDRACPLPFSQCLRFLLLGISTWMSHGHLKLAVSKLSSQFPPDLPFYLPIPHRRKAPPVLGRNPGSHSRSLSPTHHDILSLIWFLHPCAPHPCPGLGVLLQSLVQCSSLLSPISHSLLPPGPSHSGPWEKPDPTWLWPFWGTELEPRSTSFSTWTPPSKKNTNDNNVNSSRIWYEGVSQELPATTTLWVRLCPALLSTTSWQWS